MTYSYYGLPDDKWTDNPWVRGERNLDYINDINRHVIGGEFANRYVKEKAAFMSPEQAIRFNAWAMAHPTVNPRTWAPLAKAGIDPYSETGMAVAQSDIARTSFQNSYDATVGRKQSNPMPPQQDPDAVEGEDDGDPIGPDWMWGAFGKGVAAAAANPVVQGAAGGVTSATAPVRRVMDDYLNTAKLAVSAFSTPIQFQTAAMRESLGAQARLNDAQDKIGKKYGLSPEQMTEIDNSLRSPANAPGANPAFAIVENIMGDGSPAPATAEEAREQFLAKGYDAVTADRMTRAWEEYEQRFRKVTDPEKAWDKRWEQTEASVVVRSFTDGVKGNYWNARPEDGARWDPKKRIWIKPDGNSPADWVDHNGIFLPADVRIPTELAAIKSYDIRTEEEKLAGVDPIAWTLGRGLAHKVWDADETAFWTASGVVDFAYNLGLDPVNAIPVGAFGKAIRGGTLAGKAFSATGDDLIVLSRGSRFTFGPGGVRLPPATYAARQGAVDAVNEVGADILARGGRVVADNSIVEQGWDVVPTGGFNPTGAKVMKINDAGAVNAPHVKYVMKDYTWQWLNSPTGLRTLENIVEETSPHKMWLKTNGKIDYQLAEILARTTSTEEAMAALGTRIGFDITDARQLGALRGRSPLVSRVPVIGETLARGLEPSGMELEGSGLLTSRGRSALARMNEKYGYVGAVRSLYRSPFRLAPTSGVGFSTDDKTTVAEELTRALRGYRYDDDDISRIVDEVNSYSFGEARYAAIYDEQTGVLAQVMRNMINEQGLSEDTARKVTRAFAGGIDQARTNWFNSHMGKVSYGAATNDGSGPGKALLLSEVLGNMVYLPDYRTLRATTGTLGNIEKVFGKGTLDAQRGFADFLTTVTSVWRDTVLMRPAYVLREAGEMAFSLSLAGGHGAFTHPFTFAAAVTQAAAAAHLHTKLAQMVQKAVKGPLKGLDYVIDEAGRVLLSNADERTFWLRYADLPDIERPSQLRGLDADGIEALWKSLRPAQRSAVFMDVLDKDDMLDYLVMQQSFKWLFPSVTSNWANVQGESMFKALENAANGDEVAYQRYLYEMNHVTGNLAIDEPAARGATRNIETLLVGNEGTRTQYIDALIESKYMVAAHDPVMRMIAKGMSDEEIIQSWRGGREWKRAREMRRDLWGGQGHHDPPSEANVTVGDDQIYVMNQRQALMSVVGDDPDLLQAIATNKFNGQPLDLKNVGLKNAIREKMDDPAFINRLPQTVNHFPFNKNLAGRWTAAANQFFTFTGDISDLFVRSPAVREFYVDRVLELADNMSPSAKREIVANLRRAGDYALAKKVMNATKDPTRRPNVGTLTLDEIDGIASGYALRQMRRTFYNAHRRQNYAVAFRTLAPFIQSTMNTFKRWGLFTMQNPHLAYRTLKPIEALRDPGSAVIYEVLGNMFGDEGMKGLYSPGHEEASVDGFFFENEYGDRVFGFPAVRSVYNVIARATGQQQMPEGSVYTGRAQNLNVAGTSLNPGTGPLVTFPAAMLTGDKIYQDNPVGELLRGMFPYGLPQGKWYDKMIGAFSPTAVKKVVITPEEQANQAAKLLPSLAATGEYDLTSDADIRRMIGDASELSYRMGGFSALAGMFTPTTGNWDYAIEIAGEGDPDGVVRTFMMQDVLRTQWFKYTEAKTPATAQDDYSNGALRFINDYGLFAFYSVQPRSEMKDTAITSSPTGDVWSFRTEEPDTYEKYRSVIAVFFPGGDPVGEWTDTEANLYSWQRASGEREYKEPLDYWEDANTALGWLVYGAANRQLALQVTDPQQQAVIRAQLADDTRRAFPGWDNESIGENDFNKAMGFIEEAVNDPVMQTLPGTPYIATYVAAREEAIQSLRDKGYSGTLNADYAALERSQLASLAGQLAAQDSSGTFAYAWARLFYQELEDPS